MVDLPTLLRIGLPIIRILVAELVLPYAKIPINLLQVGACPTGPP